MDNTKTLPVNNILKDTPPYGHGGDIYNNDVKYDFSVNTNPLGIPETVKIKLTENIDIRCQKKINGATSSETQEHDTL